MKYISLADGSGHLFVHAVTGCRLFLRRVRIGGDVVDPRVLDVLCQIGLPTARTDYSGSILKRASRLKTRNNGVSLLFQEKNSFQPYVAVIATISNVSALCRAVKGSSAASNVQMGRLCVRRIVKRLGVFTAYSGSRSRRACKAI